MGTGGNNESTVVEFFSKDVTLKGNIQFVDEEYTVPLRGEWEFAEDMIQQNDPNANPASLVFQPVIEKGDFICKARIDDGTGGIRILLNYQKPTNYFVWNIGGEENSTISLEQWNTLDGDYSIYIVLNDLEDFTLERGMWHSIRVTVDVKGRMIEGYIDGQKLLEFKTKYLKPSQFGLGTWQTHAKFESVEMNVY